MSTNRLKLQFAVGALLVVVGLMTNTGCVPAGDTGASFAGPAAFSRPVARAVCDPFASASTATASDEGLSGSLFALPAGASYDGVVNFQSKSVKESAAVYLSALDIPTEPFDRGFATDDGALLKDNQGNVLTEYFSLHLESGVTLAPGQSAGLYQFAVLSDDGAIVSVDEGNGLAPLIDDDGDHPSRLGCADHAVALAPGRVLPLQVDYYQGPRYNIALMLLWRQVSASTDLSDPACGMSGNNAFFDPAANPPSPQPAWTALLARGWQVLAPANYRLPAQAGESPCAASRGGPEPAPSPSTSIACMTENFNGGGPAAGAPVDILLVTDDTDDDDDYRAEIASSLGSFVAQLPAGTDYQVGVALGHGSDSCHTGKLLDHEGWLVLGSRSLSLSQIESKLVSALQDLPKDGDSLEGEEGLYSLSRMLDHDSLKDARAQGFFRPGASLVVLLLSDDGNACGDRADARWGDGDSRHRDCLSVSPASVMAQLWDVQGRGRFAVGVLKHVGHGFNPGDSTSNDDDDFARLAHGQSIAADEPSCGQALGQLGHQAAATLSHRVDFQLAHSGWEVDPSTVSTRVDGAGCGHNYDPGTSTVTLTGSGGNTVSISYCYKQVTQLPQPTPSPVPSPSASVAPTPSPSPSASPAPSPSPSSSPCMGVGCGGGVFGV